MEIKMATPIISIPIGARTTLTLRVLPPSFLLRVPTQAENMMRTPVSLAVSATAMTPPMLMYHLQLLGHAMCCVTTTSRQAVSLTTPAPTLVTWTPTVTLDSAILPKSKQVVMLCATQATLPQVLPLPLFLSNMNSRGENVLTED